jgi:hypothetical protein
VIDLDTKRYDRADDPSQRAQPPCKDETIRDVETTLLNTNSNPESQQCGY